MSALIHWPTTQPFLNFRSLRCRRQPVEMDMQHEASDFLALVSLTLVVMAIIVWCAVIAGPA